MLGGSELAVVQEQLRAAARVQTSFDEPPPLRRRLLSQAHLHVDGVSPETSPSQSSIDLHEAGMALEGVDLERLASSAEAEILSADGLARFSSLFSAVDAEFGADPASLAMVDPAPWSDANKSPTLPPIGELSATNANLLASFVRLHTLQGLQ